MVAVRGRRACRLVSGWSTGDLRPLYFPFSSTMAIHGAVRQDYSKGALHPPAIFRRYEWWRLISLWTRSQSSRVQVKRPAPPQSSCLVCSAWLKLTSSAQSTLLPRFNIPLSTTLSPQTVRISRFSARESKHAILNLFPSVCVCVCEPTHVQTCKLWTLTYISLNYDQLHA